MKIIFHKKFTKHFQKLPANLKTKVIQTIKKFGQNPFNQSLNNHALTGKLINLRAISVTREVRIIFEEQDNYMLVIMIDVGSHNVVYY